MGGVKHRHEQSSFQDMLGMLVMAKPNTCFHTFSYFNLSHATIPAPHCMPPGTGASVCDVAVHRQLHPGAHRHAVLQPHAGAAQDGSPHHRAPGQHQRDQRCVDACGASEGGEDARGG